MSKYTLLIEKDGQVETWSSMKKFTEAHDINTNTMYHRKLPFTFYDGTKISRIENNKKEFDINK